MGQQEARLELGCPPLQCTLYLSARRSVNKYGVLCG